MWKQKTGCSTDQYKRAYGRWYNLRYFGNEATGFTLEQEIVRAMETDNGTVVKGATRKKTCLAVQDNGVVPVLKPRRKRIFAPTPDALAVPPPIDACWTESLEDWTWLDEQD
jgi:hypothetical protein